jgi:uncharacterized repeat protein (TIGR02543 family)/uncharacterized repeat protein (TIGR01451 family)
LALDKTFFSPGLIGRYEMRRITLASQFLDNSSSRHNDKSNGGLRTMAARRALSALFALAIMVTTAGVFAASAPSASAATVKSHASAPHWTHPTYTVTYFGNGNTGGTAPVDSDSPYANGSTVTVLTDGTLVDAGFTFAGWNTQAGGGGTSYAPSVTFAITCNVDLYAQWTSVVIPPTYTVTYHGNGNTGGTAPVDVHSPYASGSTVTVLGEGTLVDAGFNFVGWNTQAGGGGTSYAPSVTFAITCNVDLYAQWTSVVIPPTYSVQIVKTGSVTSYSGASVVVTYTYTVTNPNSVQLDNVTVTDPMSGLSAISCPSTTLGAGLSEQCTATYTTTTTDVTKGSITNVGTVNAVVDIDVNSPPTVTATSTLVIPYAPTAVIVATAPPVTHPGISLTKTASTNTYGTAGQVITYTYVITNSGDVALPSAQYKVTDNLINGGVSFDCGAPQALAIGGTITCTGTYTITSGDLSTGTVTNLATASNGSQTSGVATATITATVSITTTVPSSPSKIPPTKIPSSAPSTGLGGSAKVLYNGGLLSVGGMLILAGLVVMSVMIRRRRA